MKPASVTLLACMLITLVLGSIHAFSVFLIPFEQLLGASRSQISLIYSAALVCLTLMVLVGYKIYPLFSAPVLTLITFLTAAVGTFIAGHSSSLLWVFIGYAVIFGAANGIGYGFALQLSAQAKPQRKGMAMGTVTACYALGAAIAPNVYNFGLAMGGLGYAMNLASLIFVMIGLLVYVLLKFSRAKYKGEDEVESLTQNHSLSKQLLLWVGYGAGSAAGLMIIGHATGIMYSIGGSDQQAILAVMLIAVSNMLGGLIAGWLADRIKLKLILMVLPLGSALASITMSINTQPLLLLITLTVIGFCYGAIIAVYPVAVSTIFGAASSSRIYGRVFTAWGFVGLIGPWLAGYLFDQSASYTMALIFAAVVSVISIVAAIFITKSEYSSA